MAKISVIGSGGWGIALTILLHKNGHDLTIWSFDKKEAEELKKTRQNKTKLPNILLPEDVKVTDDLKEAVDDKDILILAVPSKAIRSVSKSLKNIIKDNQIVVNVAKGLEEDTLETMTDIIEEELKDKNPKVAVLSGPSHAEEVGRGIPTTCVVSAHNKELTLYLQNIFMNPSFRVYTSPDMLGVEIGGALKNVIALAAGIADGLNYGDNTKAALITRGIKEIAFTIIGLGAYSRLKFESGVHRVQRVPKTEASGRIHTSTATVAVLPEVEDVQEVTVDPKDLKIDTYRSGGAGGQHVNMTDSAVRITHLPTGIVVQCQDERSQLKNREKAMKHLLTKLYEMEQEKQRSEVESERRLQVGTGDRAEKIRTYNFPDGRITDHRIKLTVHQLEAFLDGDIDEMIDALITFHQAELLSASEQ